MHVRIHTFADDLHALAVAHGLKRLGATYELVFNHTLASDGSFHIRLGAEHEALGFDREAEHNPSAIWFRRFRRINIPDWIDARDHRPAEGEWDAALRSLRLISPSATGAFCVNPAKEAAAAGLKPVQLQKAVMAGLRIPETLITNSVDEVRAFERDAGPIIYKSLISPGWVLENDVDTWIPTTPVRAAELPADSLQACPGIFQTYVEKAFEVRMTVMGREVFAVRINSQNDPRTVTDWKARAGSTQDLLGGLVSPPDQVRDAVFTLMEDLGLVFGCFDFIVGPKEVWTFLEVNPQGQFLWLEAEDGAVNLLDAFCRFLLSGDPEFRYRPDDDRLIFREVMRGPRDPAWIAANRDIPAYLDPFIVME